jgi:hypothetical protein
MQTMHVRQKKESSSMSKDVHCPECGCEISSDLMSADQMRKRFMALIRECHGTLKDADRQRFPSHETLRKHALIAVGWCTVRTVVAGSKTAAQDVADALKDMDRYCIIDVRGDVLTVYRARSMSRRALLKPQFLDVSQKVFDWIYQQTGIEAERAAA